LFLLIRKNRMSRTAVLAEKPLVFVSPKKEVSSQKIPNFFIVGGPKCGTTALDQYLSSHSDIFVSNKEMHFFGSDLQFGSQFYRRDEKAYRAEFEGWKGQACVGETSVWYLFSRRAAAEIKAFNPESRIIIMLREPAAMLYSLYHQFRCDGNEHLRTFEEALQAEEDRSAGRRLARQTYFRQGLIYRSVTRYTEQVKRYFDAFGRDRVHVILYDDFAADTAGVYHKALAFLGVCPSRVDPAMDFRVINGNQTVKSPVLRSLLQDPLVRGTAIALGSRLPKPVFAAVQKIGLQLSSLNLRSEKRSEFAPELQRSLRREFAPEVDRLGELLGRDLSHWSNPDKMGNRVDSKAG
jgi:Sulfotransferase domain